MKPSTISARAGGFDQNASTSFIPSTFRKRSFRKAILFDKSAAKPQNLHEFRVPWL
jgi:hypothetical protein